jgi:hypothetical protein
MPRDATRLHDLRHFCGNHGVEVRTTRCGRVPDLGHSRVETTKNIYFDFMPKDATGATDAIGDAIVWDR